MRERMRRLLVLALAGVATAPATTTAAQNDSASERVTYADAVKRALDRHPTVGQAEQAVQRARALLAQSRAVFQPLATGFASETILDDARGFAGNITQPRKQAAFRATLSFPLFAPSRWAQAKQAADQVQIARISEEEARRQVALTAAQAYLAVLAARHQADIASRNRDTAKTLADYAKTRLEAGQGSRLNFVRASQELAAAEGLVQGAELATQQAREALGVAIFAEGPVDTDGEPELAEAAPPSDDAGFVERRPDVRLFSAQAQAADRVVRDDWKSWLPTAEASFTPQYVTPKGFFEPARTWRALFEVQVPIFDATLGSTRKLRIADRESARLRLQEVQVEARAEVRSARDAVERHEHIEATTREAAENAAEALRITEVAYRAGASTNVEVVQAQQTARGAQILAALAADRLLLARLDLLVALGQFPR